VVRLALFDDEDNQVFCTATVLGSRYAVTAAHCLNELVFRAELQRGQERIAVRDIIRHPNYTGRFVDGRLLSDVALVEVDAALPFPKARVSFDAIDAEREFVHVFGYGVSRVGGASFGAVNPLRGVSLTVDALSAEFLFNRFDSAADGNVCFGDSGGPAFIKDGDSAVLVGITSTGVNADCAVGDVSAFTRLSAPGIADFVSRGIDP
jgi:secreted trypsin-like serine protease